MGKSFELLALFLCLTKLSDAYFFRGMCYVDSGHRVLPHARINDHSLTIEKCIAHCRSCNYDYAGVEYGHECWCGNQEPASSLRRHYSECSAKCPGNQYQRCGGTWRINVYKVGSSIRGNRNLQGSYETNKYKVLKKEKWDKNLKKTKKWIKVLKKNWNKTLRKK